ncbi:preprotein translocase subunit SecE [Caproicibacter fermentans]|uniref:preprotein translocase subunit SecE n=1 Tax=Caproicibacter fermentans TaxID=2576756 RepID=UPI001E547F17|nr:preprotein translocase subunit SecE [Caproicibacter fermentans]
MERKKTSLPKLAKVFLNSFAKPKAKPRKWSGPPPRSVFKNTGVVLATIIVIGLFVFGLDTLLVNLLGLIMNVAK